MNFTAEDRGDHYLIDEGDGAFRVDKDGLDEDVDRRIRMAMGGVVRREGYSFARGGVVGDIPVLPGPSPAVIEFFRDLYPKDEEKPEKEEDEPEDEGDEPDAGVQKFATGDMVLEPDDAISAGLPNLGTVPLPAPGASGEVVPSSTVMHLPEMRIGESDDYDAMLRRDLLDAADAADKARIARMTDALDAAQVDPSVGGGSTLDRAISAAAMSPAMTLVAPGVGLVPHAIGAVTAASQAEPAPPPTQAPLEGDQTFDPGALAVPPRPRLPGEMGAGGRAGVSVSSAGLAPEVPDFKPDPALVEAAKAKAQAARDVAEVNAAASEAAADVARDEAEINARAAARMREIQRDVWGAVDRIQKDLLEARVDPNRIYHNMSTGQRVASVAAIILGGLGATIAGIGRGGKRGRNVGLAMLQRAAERDVEAQKADIENKHSVMRSLIQKGHDLMSAEKIALGISLDSMAAQLKAIGAAQSRELSNAELPGVIADLEVEAAKNIQEGIANSIEAWAKPRLVAAQIGDRNRAIVQAQVAANAAAQEKATVADAIWRIQHRRGTEDDYAVATSARKDLQERLVRTPTGWAMTNAKGDGATKVRQRLTDIEQSAHILRQLVHLAREANEAILGNRRIPFTSEAVDVLVTEDLIAKVKASGLGAYDKGLQALLDDLRANPADIFQRPSATLARLEKRLDLAENYRSNVINAELAGPSAGRQSSRREP